MYPDDRVLVGVMPNPDDLTRAMQQHWYRVPVEKAPKGIHAEYIAFYFTRHFPEDLRWGIHYYARRTGHELARRVELLPDEPDHPRAQQMYFKVQLGTLKRKSPPIVSQTWRRITFIHTTWDRFVAAREVSDLFSTDPKFVDRVYHALRMRGMNPQRDVAVAEGDDKYRVDLVIDCHDGPVMFSARPDRPSSAHLLSGDTALDLETIERAVEASGGPLTLDLPL